MSKPEQSKLEEQFTNLKSRFDDLLNALSQMTECKGKARVVQHALYVHSSIEDWYEEVLGTTDEELQEGLRCRSCGELIDDGEEEGRPRYCETCEEDDMVQDDEDDEEDDDEEKEE